MTSEFLLEVFSIKIKIKGYLKNETEKTTENFEIFGIKNKERITYIIDGTKYKLDLKEKNINLIRENEEFIHSIVFIKKKTTDTIYLPIRETYEAESVAKTEIVYRNTKFAKLCIGFFWFVLSAIISSIITVIVRYYMKIRKI